MNKKKPHPKEKSSLHERNKHRARYDFQALIKSCPELAPFVKLNDYEDESIDFFNPEAVKMLNKALLKHYYSIEYWDLPPNYLCPPIPGRADYIHNIADVLGESNAGKIPTGEKIRCLDIGVGANCIYPIIGNKEYGWSFVGSDIDPVAIESAKKIVEMNAALKGEIEIRLQENAANIFKGIIHKGEKFDLTICNPPFHASAEEAQSSAIRKISNLKNIPTTGKSANLMPGIKPMIKGFKKINKPVLNFGGKNKELWTEGGEVKFIQDMIRESKEFAESVHWFSTIVSKHENLKYAYEAFEKAGEVEVIVIPMGQGNKKSRIVAWSFTK